MLSDSEAKTRNLILNARGNISAIASIIKDPEDLKLPSTTALNEFNDLFMDELDNWIFAAMQRGFVYSAVEINRLNPRYEAHAGWLPADDALYREIRNNVEGYVNGLVNDMGKAIAKEISDGITAGLSLQDIAANVAAVFDKNMNRAILITRTEIIRAFNRAAEARYNRAGIQDYRWLTALDPTVCEICKPKNGKLVHAELDGKIPPVHPLCRCTITPVV